MLGRGSIGWGHYLEDGPPLSKWLGSPPFIRHEVRPFGRGPTTRSLGDLRSSWLLTTYDTWDDPPSKCRLYFDNVVKPYLKMVKLQFHQPKIEKCCSKGVHSNGYKLITMVTFHFYWLVKRVHISINMVIYKYNSYTLSETNSSPLKNGS